MNTTLLITGATGVLGSALIPRMVRRHRDATVYLLIRADSDEALGERMEKLYGFWADQDLPSWKERVVPLRGDVTAPHLGLDKRDYEMLADRCTHIVHSAASVKMNMTEEQAMTSSCVATQAMLGLARSAMDRGPMRQFDYVSTIGVGGLLEGTIPEKPLRMRRGFHNTYESSKAVAEEMVLAEMQKGLPVTIHRPSMIVGDSLSGKVLNFQVFYYLLEFLSGRYSGGLLPELGDYRLDIVPVDYAARIIEESVYGAAAVGTITHICSGKLSFKLADLVPFARRLRSDRSVPLRTIPFWMFGLLVGMSGLSPSEKSRKALRNFRHFLPYLKSHQVFDNTWTRARFSQVVLPQPKEYLETIGAYYGGRKAREVKA